MHGIYMYYDTCMYSDSEFSLKCTMCKDNNYDKSQLHCNTNSVLNDIDMDFASLKHSFTMAATNTSVCTHDDVKEYYGKTLKASTDLKTNVCCVGKRSLPQAAKEAMKLIHPNVMAK